MKTVDLSEYTVESLVLPGYGLVLKSPYGSMLKTLYTNPASAIGEVVYSRLSRKLGLAVVESEYSTNLADVVGIESKFPQPSSLVSVSSYSELWVQDGDEQNGFKKKTEVDAHMLVGLTLREPFNTRGFVTEDGNYIKAYNGAAVWCGIDLRMFLLDRSLSGLLISNKKDASYIEADNQGKYILPKIADLSDEDIQDIIDMPDWDGKEKAQRFLINRLEESRSTATEYLQ